MGNLEAAQIVGQFRAARKNAPAARCTSGARVCLVAARGDGVEKVHEGFKTSQFGRFFVL
jgi:hypothetical protein